MAAYPISSALKDFIVSEQSRVYDETGDFWCEWELIEGSDYCGLSSDNFSNVMSALDRAYKLKSEGWKVSYLQELMAEVVGLVKKHHSIEA